MSDPKGPQMAVSLQRQVIQRFRDAMDTDVDISPTVAQVVWAALEKGDLDREAFVARVMAEITDDAAS